MRQLRQPRLAEIVASSLRNDILSGKLKEGDFLPPQDQLFEDFGVSLPAVREAMRILETDGLISVRRGNAGGAIVHLPSTQRTARIIGMILQSRLTSLSDVSGALMDLEPVCAGLCAARADRAEHVLPRLTELHQQQREALDHDVFDVYTWSRIARQFHEAIVETCGNETMKIVIGSLSTIWSAHESTVWGEATRLTPDDDPTVFLQLQKAAFRDHEHLISAIETGDEDRAIRVARAHLTATRKSTLESSNHDTIRANLLDDFN